MFIVSAIAVQPISLDVYNECNKEYLQVYAIQAGCSWDLVNNDTYGVVHIIRNRVSVYSDTDSEYTKCK